jgi:SagB-type dehydrogenase family enzyme
MKWALFACLLLLFPLFSACKGLTGIQTEAESPYKTASRPDKEVLKLPDPRLKSQVSLEESLLKRRSVREFTEAPLTLEEVSQLLWAAQGITAANGGRTAPSAGALYPLEVYLAAGQIEGLGPGIYQYRPEGHEILQIDQADLREKLSQAALGQSAVKNGAINLIISAVYARTTPKYGDRGIRYALIEVGHAAQNICLEAAALDLGAVTIGAFNDSQVKSLLGLSEDESPLYIVPVGHKQ